MIVDQNKLLFRMFLLVQAFNIYTDVDVNIRRRAPPS